MDQYKTTIKLNCNVLMLVIACKGGSGDKPVSQTPGENFKLKPSLELIDWTAAWWSDSAHISSLGLTLTTAYNPSYLWVLPIIIGPWTYKQKKYNPIINSMGSKPLRLHKISRLKPLTKMCKPTAGIISGNLRYSNQTSNKPRGGGGTRLIFGYRSRLEPLKVA